MKLIDCQNKTAEPELLIADAATALRQGKLVAFPTETVYGLGANAFDENAIKRIFVTKGRPQDNPLIVHIDSVESLPDVVGEVTPLALLLYKQFAPGPLTLVQKRQAELPQIISAGLGTVAVRIPSHPIAQALLHQAKVPVVAPSANKSGRPSPTTAAHVVADYGQNTSDIAYLLDGGSADEGVESTVLDVTTDPPTLLRPGTITKEQIEAVLGYNIDVASKTISKDDSPRSPGMKYRHYAPNCAVKILRGENATEKALNLSQQYHNLTPPLAYFGNATTLKMAKELGFSCDGEYITSAQPDVALATAHLFDALRQLETNASTIIVEGFSANGIGAAYMNRVEKAAGSKLDQLPNLAIMFVSTGNLCRSPLAALCFNRAYQDRLGTLARSCGIAQVCEKSAHPFALQVASEQGGDLILFQPYSISQIDLSGTNVIVTMTKSEAAYVKNLLDTKLTTSKIVVKTFGELIGKPELEVCDPINGSIELVRLTWQIFADAFSNIPLEKLKLHAE